MAQHPKPGEKGFDNLDRADLREVIAFIAGQQKAMEEELNWLRPKAAEALALDAQAKTLKKALENERGAYRIALNTQMAEASLEETRESKIRRLELAAEKTKQENSYLATTIKDLKEILMEEKKRLSDQMAVSAGQQGPAKSSRSAAVTQAQVNL
jgi:hypothetical protein